MKDYKIPLRLKSVFEDNDRGSGRTEEGIEDAEDLSAQSDVIPWFRKNDNTEKTIDMLKDEMKIGVMEADIDSDGCSRHIGNWSKGYSAAYRRNAPSGC